MATTVESLRKSIGKKKPSRAFAWLADLLCRNGDLDGALQCAQEGILQFPDSEEGLLVLSKIWMQKEDFDQVIEACESVLLKNPYCLSALRRLGDAYDKKGDEESRNHYYQLLHDLDPLDAFWSEEYAPKITEALMDAPVAAAAAEPSLDAILKDAPPLNLPEDAPLKEEPLNLPAEPQESEAPKADSIFEKSLENEPAKDIHPESVAENSKSEEDDPFSSLSSLLPANDEHDEEVSFGDLEHSLDDALAGFAPTNTDKDQFPTDEIDGSDISSALSGIFGPAETEESADEESSDGLLKEALPAEEPVKEDKPQSLSDAFDDIFGEDELPEEFVPSALSESPSAISEGPSESSASSTPSESAPAPSLESSVESSFDSLFGNESDALPSEDLTLPADSSPAPSAPSTPSDSAPAPSLESSVESSFDSLFGNESDALPSEDLTLPADSSPAPSAPSTPSDSAPAPSLESSVESSFDSLFGNESDALPSEDLTLPADSSPAPSAPSTPSDSAPAPSLESSVESSFDSLFGNESDALPSEDLTLPADSSPAPSAPSTPSDSAPAPSLESSVESSFDSLFGNESDALEEDPTTSTRTLAEIYFEQGVYDESIKIYKDLIRKSPDDASLQTRLEEIEKIRHEKLNG